MRQDQATISWLKVTAQFSGFVDSQDSPSRSLTVHATSALSVLFEVPWLANYVNLLPTPNSAKQLFLDARKRVEARMAHGVVDNMDVFEYMASQALGMPNIDTQATPGRGRC